jgi:O-antigen ligase
VFRRKKKPGDCDFLAACDAVCASDATWGRGVRRAVFGIGAYLVALPFLPAQAASVALVGLAAYAARQPSGEAGVWTRHAPFLLSLTPFLAAQILATLRSPEPAQATAVLSFFLPGLVLFFIMTERRDWPLHAWIWIWTGFCAALSLSVIIGWARLQLGASVPPAADVPQAALFLSGNQMLLVPNDICAAAAGMAFPLALLVSPGARRLTRAAGLCAILLTLFAMTILRTRAGFAVLSGELLFVALAWRSRLLLAFPAGLVLVAAADFGLHLQLMGRLLFANTLENHGIVGRLGLWASAWGMFSTAPLLGHGAQSFRPMHAAFLPAWVPPFPERHVFWAHSLYLETLAEQGLTGAASLIYLLLQPFSTLWHGLPRGKSETRIQLYAAVAVSAIVGFALAAAVEFTFTRRAVSLIMFGILGFAWRACQPDLQSSYREKPSTPLTGLEIHEP